MAQARTLSSLAPNKRNPRKITAEKREMLAKALEQFGDLGGIVFNQTSGQLVGGHQRTQAFQKMKAAITITKAYDKPTARGTVAEGYVEVDGERYAYREVQWSPKIEKAANLAANNSVGSWDMPMVATWLAELDGSGFEMDLTLFDTRELEMFSYELPRKEQPMQAQEPEPEDIGEVRYDSDDVERLPPGAPNFTMPSEMGKARGRDKDPEIKAEEFESFAATCPRCNFHFNPK